tara:strand:- start:86 stop:763 length:678 start_codon:yes stop_codon:yes gene_type:complete
METKRLNKFIPPSVKDQLKVLRNLNSQNVRIEFPILHPDHVKLSSSVLRSLSDDLEDTMKQKISNYNKVVLARAACSNASNYLKKNKINSMLNNETHNNILYDDENNVLNLDKKTNDMEGGENMNINQEPVIKSLANISTSYHFFLPLLSHNVCFVTCNKKGTYITNKSHNVYLATCNKKETYNTSFITNKLLQKLNFFAGSLGVAAFLYFFVAIFLSITGGKNG